MHGRGFSSPRSRHQRRFAARQRLVRIGAMIQQQFNHRRVAVGTGLRQDRHPIAVNRAGLGAGIEQDFRQGDIVEVRGPVQSGGSIDLRDVDVRMRGDQRLHPRAITFLRSVGDG